MNVVTAGVIGHPVAHSKSPLIHRYWLDKYGISGEYKAYDIPPENLRAEILRLRDKGFAGVNVTLPHKQAVMDICTTLTDEAQKIGAVNTIVFYPSGEIEGRNTDAYGFITNVKEICPGFLFKNKPALVFGAGGAARAILHALKKESVAEIRISNRTIEHAEILAEEFGATVYDWSQREDAVKDAGVIINTTSLGMTGKPPLEINLTALASSSIVCDIVYAPQETELLIRARQKNCRTVAGLGMLFHQARPAFQAFFGVLPDVTDDLVRQVGA